MRSSFSFLRIVSMLFACAGVLALTTPAQAAERGFYLGADVASMQTELYYGESESYSTTHARLKVGYQFLNFLSVEGRIMSSDYNTDIDFLGGQYRFDTGTMLGLYVRPHTHFRNANVYGIFGLTSMDTKYRLVAPVTGPVESDTVIALTAGVGGSFRIVSNLTFDIEGTIYLGNADYGAYGTPDVDITSFGLSAGLRYRF